MPSDPGKLLGALSQVMGLVGFRPGELEQRLELVVSTAAAVFDVSGAGLMLTDNESHLRLVGASDDAGRALELAQQEIGEGPGIEATRRQRIVTLSDFSRDHRWPQIRRLVEPLGIMSLISAPVSLGEQALGNLNLFDRSPREWTQADRDGADAFARVTGVFLRIALEAHHGGQLVAELSSQLTSDRIGPVAHEPDTEAAPGRSTAGDDLDRGHADD